MRNLNKLKFGIFTIVFFLVFILMINGIILLMQNNKFKEKDSQLDITNIVKYRIGDSPVLENDKFLWLYDNNQADWKEIEPDKQPADINDSEFLWMKVELPLNNMKSPSVLLILEGNQSFQVYLKQEKIYEFGQMGRNIGGLDWHIIDIPKDYGNKNLYIRIHSGDKYKIGIITKLEIGEKSNHIFYFIENGVDYFIVGLFLVFIAAFLISVYILLHKSGKAALYLSLFSFFTGIWFIIYSPLTQFIADYPYIFYYISNIELFIGPYYFCKFIQQILVSNNKIVIKILVRGYLILGVILTLLDLGNISKFYSTYILLHSYIIISMIVILVIVGRETLYGNEETKIFLVGFGIYTIFIIYDILGFLFRIIPWNRFLHQWGVIVFICSLIIILLLRFIKSELQLEINQKKLIVLAKYANDLEFMSNEIKSKEHNFKNILLTMKGYVDRNEFESVKKYFYKVINYNDKGNKKINSEILDSNNLKNIGDIPLKYFLIEKIIDAYKLKVQVSLDIPKKIDYININSIDLNVILGVFIDNAIHAAILCEEKTIVIAIIKYQEYIEFIIENHCVEESGNIDILFRRGYSTKGINRGIGLADVRKIINNYDNVSLSTKWQDFEFTQILMVEDI